MKVRIVDYFKSAMEYIGFNCSHAIASRVQSRYNMINMSFPGEFTVYYQSSVFLVRCFLLCYEDLLIVYLIISTIFRNDRAQLKFVLREYLNSHSFYSLTEFLEPQSNNTYN